MGCGASAPVDSAVIPPDPVKPDPKPVAKGSDIKVDPNAGRTSAAGDGLASSPLSGKFNDYSVYGPRGFKSLFSLRERALTQEEKDLITIKHKLIREWSPEYTLEEVRPPQDTPDVHSERATNVTLSMVLKEQEHLVRKTKIICTAGPACWSEENLGKLLDAGLNVLRLNFSHGDHNGHYEVLERFRKVKKEKGSRAATLLDTKGPEIRTAMLKGKKIKLEAGQPIIVEAVGARYTEFEGYKDEATGETRIGLSYDKLCQSVFPGNRILLADGSISIKVEEILNDHELRGTVMNSKELGERKNCNLPGVKVDIPVLTAKDIEDLQQFAAKYQMDFVAASFVQTAEDVKFIRRVLDEAGGNQVKIISKIENLEGLNNFDAILAETDGIMVARGDLGMEIPSEKVPVAQKMMITKCNVAGKFVICATQMLESMIKNPRPTRAEMTDVANAVYDGVDCVMLSGESANGDFPDTAVSTMAAIVANAEPGVDYYSQYSFIRYWASKGNSISLSATESVLSSAAFIAVSFTEDTTPEALQMVRARKEVPSVIAVITRTGHAANLVAKYRPPVPVVVVSTEEAVLRQCSVCFGHLPIKVDSLELETDQVANMAAAEVARVMKTDNTKNFKVIVARGAAKGDADVDPAVTVVRLGANGLHKGNKSYSTATSLVLPSGTPVQRPGVRSQRATLTSLPLIIKPLTSVHARSTKIICTMGPKCWGEEMLNKLLDAGMDIVRLNFSHGEHAGHLEVLERFRKVCKARSDATALKLPAGPQWAALLDTKGPEIRTAMLRDHKNIKLEAGQSIIVQAVGEQYTKFEGYKDEFTGETRIGLSYDKLCQGVKPGNKILLADGSISIRVEEILSTFELRGTVLNSKELGERKNCNLPGVKVDIPVLTAKDIEDLQQFAAKYELDYVAASFVQSKEDVQFIRRTLDEAQGTRVKIISKIENAEGLNNYDEILLESDGIMVARGDLGMEIPAEKVPLAQKMMITKANIAGKFIITATQMLESMIDNPRPTRAEMTDVANAVLDGTDCVMLSGETANGDFPAEAVATMAAICANAEEMSHVHKRYDFIRNHSPKPMMGAEAVCSGAVQTAIDVGAKAIICITASGRAPGLVSKYRPHQPVVVVTPDVQLVRHCRSVFGQVGMLHQDLEQDVIDIVEAVRKFTSGSGIVEIEDGDHVVVLKRRRIQKGQQLPYDDQRLIMKALVVGSPRTPSAPRHTAYSGNSIIYHRSTKIGLDTITDDVKYRRNMRKTKIICTAGPACWSEEMLGKLLDAGLNVLRFNFSHGDHKGHLEVLERYRKVCTAKGSYAAALLDTKGPEIRTAMLKGKKIKLEAGQSIIVEAVGPRYTEFEGYKDETTGETRIGLSYEKLCQSVTAGNRLLLADGSISIKVEEILNDHELRGTVLNSKELGERKNCNLPGVKVDIPVLTAKDIGDLQQFAAKYQMDFVAASFVQTKEDVLFIRRVLDEAGGQNVKIISKIENAEGLHNFDKILEVTDGIMVARGDLGMEIPVEKVPLAQKMMITKANIAGKFIITATQMLESMISSPIPTRAEMTDVANAVWDGTDCVMLSGESANGEYPEQAVATMHSICRMAEIGVNSYQVYDFIRSFTPKPVSGIEAVASALAKNANDILPGMIVVFSEGGKTARLLAKYRPPAPVLVVTSSAKLARACSTLFAVYTMVLDKPIETVDELETLLNKALLYGIEKGICSEGKEVIACTSTSVTTQAGGLLQRREILVTLAPGKLDHKALGSLAPNSSAVDPKSVAKTLTLRSTTISVDMLVSDSTPVRKTKIAGTIGPACSSPEILEKMVDAGMDVARFKFSHGTPGEHADVLNTLRKIAAAKGRTVAVLMDLQGPEVRTSYLIDRESRKRIDRLDLKAGESIEIYGTDNLSPETFVGYRNAQGLVRLGVDFLDLADVAKVGCMIRLRDGAIGIRVEEVMPGRGIKGKVLNGGALFERRVVHISGVTLHATPQSSMQDMQDIQQFAVQYVVDYVAASQVSGRSDIEELRSFLDDCGCESIKIVAKIETEEGLRNLDEIIESADAIMVARGNLGMSISPESVALAQCKIVTKAKIAGKPVIVARHMLESMVANPRPTRAEMTDVANAVLDGTDCVMLCSETASGAFPVDSIVTASRICANAEQTVNYATILSFIRDFTPKPFNAVEAGAVALAKACLDAKLGLAVVVSDSGQTAKVLSKYRPSVPQIVISSQPPVITQCNLVFGQKGYLVDPHKMHDMGGLEELVQGAIEWAKKTGLVTTGKVAVMHGSSTPDTEDSTLIKIIDLK